MKTLNRSVIEIGHRPCERCGVEFFSRGGSLCARCADPTDGDPPPQPAAVLPAFPNGELEVWDVSGPDLDADPEGIDAATCVYSDCNYAAAVKLADVRAMMRPGREQRVCDAAGKVWHRARARAA